MKLAFLGLGVMGYPMAGHLAKAGHEVTVYNRTAAKAQAWVKEYGGALRPPPRPAAKAQAWVKEYGGAIRPTPAAAAAEAAIVFTCVGNDDDLRQVTAGET